jgi:restriction system protein
MKLPIETFAPVVAFFLVVFLIRAVPLLFKIVMQKRANAKLAELGIESIDQLSGRDFERLLTCVFKEQGARVLLTPYVGDGGADLVIEKGSMRTVVQAKRSKPSVGVRAVQEVVASKPRYKAERAMVVTNSHFTKAAIRLAKENGVELWGRNLLIERLTELKTHRAA